MGQRDPAALRNRAQGGGASPSRPVPTFKPHALTRAPAPHPHAHSHPHPQTKVSDRYSVPMVLVVVEGGPNTLKTVREFLVGGCPVVLLRGSGGAADAICRCFDLLLQPPAGRGEQGAAGAGAGAGAGEGAVAVEHVEAQEAEAVEAEEAEAKRLGLSRGDEVRATRVSVEAELDPRYEAKRDDLRAIMLHAGGGRRLGRPLLFSFHCDAEVEFDEQLLTAVLKGRFIAPRGKLTLAVTWNSESVVRAPESHARLHPHASSLRPLCIQPATPLHPACNPSASGLQPHASSLLQPDVSRCASCSRATTRSSPRTICCSRCAPP